jgi:hypothetical protein
MAPFNIIEARNLPSDNPSPARWLKPVGRICFGTDGTTGAARRFGHLPPPS